MKVCFETFGCRLNKAEALQMEAEYLADGWELTARHADANLIVVRGCSVTARAQYDCEKMIAHLHRHYPTTPVRICGCLKSKSVRALSPSLAPSQSPSAAPAPLPTRTARAYLKVQDGCSGKCTFCIVPKFRGRSSSVDFTRVLDKAKRFVDAGYHEIVVTGCNLSLYASQGKRLPELLTALAAVDSDCRIRLGSVEPGPCALETVHAMAAKENVCRFLHLPIQSGSDRILRAMKRPYLVRDVDEAIEAATRLMPGLGLGCDMMTGFPDENDLDFTATKGLVKRHPFSNIHVFPYSERPGTPAVTFPNAVPKDVRVSRARELAAYVRRTRADFARSFVGQTVEIVMESEKKQTGWTGEYLPCKVTEPAPRKTKLKVFVTMSKGEALTGRPA